MANNLIQGKAQYAKIVGKPVPKYVDEGVKPGTNGYEWTFDLVVNADGVAQLQKLGLGDKIKTNAAGEKFIKFVRGEFKGDKVTKNDPIPIVDHRNQNWDQSVKIGNGSTLNVRFSVYPGRKGNKAFVTAVQVWDHVKFVPKPPFQAREDSPHVPQVESFTEANVQTGVAETLNDAVPFALDTDDDAA